MILNSAKIVDLTKESVNIDLIIEFEGESYELYKTVGIQREAFREGFKLIVQVNEDRTKILKLLSK